MKFSTLKFSFLLSFLIAIAYHSGLKANGIGIIDGSGVYLKVIESNVSVEVNNQIATITTSQIFRNTSGLKTMIKYAFPLNENANPIGLRWKVNGVWKTADVSTSEQDNNIPSGGNDGPGTGLDPNLVQYLGSHPLFFSPKDSIENDSLIIVELKYVELLPYFLNKVSFNYKNDISDLQQEIVELQTFDFLINADRSVVEIDLLDLHGQSNISGNSATLHFETYESISNFDYDLEYELSSDGLGAYPLSTYVPDSIFNCDSLGNGYLTMIIEPESNVNTDVIEKNFTLIIDRSGSMRGNKIVQAKDAATFIIENLNLGDYFNIVDFSTQVTSFKSEHVPFNLSTQNEALNYINAIRAGGSTNISGALTYSINQFSVVDPNKANIIIFFTDGESNVGITNTPGILNAVETEINKAETGVFLFTFGIGASVDEQLLTLLAQQNNGLVQFVKDKDLETEITRFFLSVNNPVLINTEITFTPDIIREIYPSQYPNLYKGQQFILSGRYDTPQVVNMNMKGSTFNLPVEYDFSIDLSSTNDISKSVLPKIWAKQKIDQLSLNYHLANNSSEANAIQEEIDSMSVCYGVISVEFTSFDDGSTTEVEELIAENSRFSIRATPNPFDTNLSIEINSQDAFFEAISMTIYDLQGKPIAVKQTQLNGYHSVIQWTDLGHLPSGVYLCKIQIGNEFITLRIIKK